MKHKILTIVLTISIVAPVMAGGPDVVKKPVAKTKPAKTQISREKPDVIKKPVAKIKPAKTPIELDAPIAIGEIGTVEIVKVNAGPDRTANSPFWQNATVTGATAYRWSQVSGSGKVVFSNPASEDTTISADAEGTHVIRLTATGSDGNTMYDEFTLIWETSTPNVPKGSDVVDQLITGAPHLAKEESKKKTKKKKPHKGKFLLFGNLTAYGTYSKLLGRSSIVGGNTSGMLAPTYKFNDKWLLIVLGKGYYLRSKQVFAEDRGPKLRSETANYAIQPTVRYNYSDKLSIIPSVFFSETLTRETEDEKWREGLYDYIDKGVGVDFVYKLTQKKNVFQTITLGFQPFIREYGNFVSLLNLAGLGTLEEREKDFNGYLATLSYKVRRKEAFSYTVKASGLFKQYTDKLIENSQGGRDASHQSDQVYTLGVDFDFVPKLNFAYRIDTTLTFNSSNQNLAEGSVPSIVFTPNYYEYFSIGLKPSVSYKYQLPNKRKLVLGFAYGISVRKYSDREAKDSAGLKTGKKELDFNHVVSISSTYKINKNWGVGAIASLQVARSNNKAEMTYLHNYEILNLSLGFTYRY